MEERCLSQWKYDIQSKDKSLQIETLEDIIRNLNDFDEKNYVKFINSDLNYFLSEMLIYKHRASTSLVIKILCHLSEEPEFFKNDFFRCIRPSLRLINSFSSDCLSDNIEEEAYYKRNILAFNTVILKRAQIFDVNFKDERIPKVTIVITATSLTSLDSRIIEKLEFITTVLDIFRLMQEKFDDKIYQERKLIEILKSLNFSAKDLLDVNYFKLVTKLCHTAIDFLPATNESDDKILVKLISEKFINLISFAVDERRDLSFSNYSTFLNIFYSIFTSFIFNNVHQMILNYFLTLDGLNFLLLKANSQDESTSGKLLKFKARVIISEVMLHLLKIFLELEDDDAESLSQLRQKYMKIVFKSDLQELDYAKCEGISRESMLFAAFKYYVLLKWNKMRSRKGIIASNIAFIIEAFRENKIVMDKGIVSMIFYVYTSSYVNITVNRNDLIQNASMTLMKLLGAVNIIVDFNFLKWWFLFNYKDRKAYEKLLSFLLSPKSIEEFKNLQESDLYPIDIKCLLQLFLNDKIPVENLEKVMRLLCIVPLNLKDIGRIHTFYEKHRTEQDRRRSIYALKILCASHNKLNLNRQIKTCKLARKTLKEAADMHERLLAVHLLVKLCEVAIERKRK